MFFVFFFKCVIKILDFEKNEALEAPSWSVHTGTCCQMNGAKVWAALIVKEMRTISL